MERKNIVNANENSSDEDIKRHKDVTINFLKETVDEMPRTQRDFSRMKFMYTKVKRELNEKTDDLNKEIMFKRPNKNQNKGKLVDNACPECEFKSTNKSGLERHLTTKHGMISGLIKCEECETRFKTSMI